jgi:DNA helicase-2/ATP-dependent DNA helicase PcrA
MTPFEKALSTLNAEQKQAVDSIYGPLLVIAGPGTGKTQLLSVRVANILAKTDTNPENILCLTFTESGASNMRSRLSSFIGAASYKVNINTYHAFGAELLRAYKNFTAKPTRAIETQIDRVASHKIIREIQKSLKHNDILRNAKTADLIDTIADLKTARLLPADLKIIAEENLNTSDQINDLLKPVLAKLVPRMPFKDAVGLYEEIGEILAAFTSKKPILKTVEPEANHLLAALHKILEDEKAKDKPSVSPLTKWRDKYFDKDDAGHWRLSNIISNKKLLSLAGIFEKYDETLQNGALFDFADMIEEAITALKDDKSFRLTLQEKYQFILLDEFQDTNASQFELIKLLTDYENSNTMAVGDDDQAIYEFQGARSSNLLDFAENYRLPRENIIVLTKNYRSVQPILDISKQVAGQIADRFSTNYNIEKVLTAVKSEDYQIERREFLSAPAEYNYTAGQIAALLSAGESPNKIAIIAPKHKYITSLLPYLKKHQVPVSYEKRENLFEYPPIAQLIKLAKLLISLGKAQPSAANLLEILSFDFWHIPPENILSAIYRAKEQKHSALEYLQNSDNENLKNLANFFAAAALKSIDLPLEQSLDLLTGERPLGDFRSPFLEFYTKKSDFKTYEFYENLAVLREHLSQRAKTANLKLTDFVDFADDYAAAEEKLINTSPYQDSDQAVKLLSAHSAKGLEFKHVFLVAVDDLSWGTAKGNNNTLSLPKNLEFVRHTGATEDEKLRLFFVAITRAEQYLYLTNSKSDFAGKSPARLKYLAEYDEGDKSFSPYLPEDSNEIIKDPTETLNLDDLKNHWVSSHFSPDNPDLAPILKSRLANYRLSATDLTTFIDIIYAGPEEFYKTKILRAPTEYSPNLVYGNLVHATFDRVTKEKLSDQEALNFYEAQALNSPLTEEDRDFLLEKGRDNLAAYLASRGNFLRAPTAQSEIELFDKTLYLGDTPIKGKIDHLEIDEEGKNITIVDFKTGNFHEGSWESNDALLKHKLQLLFYKLLLESSKKYPQYSINEARIEFITPDHANQIHTKTLTFGNKDLDTTKSLAKSIYTHITNLDFPNTSNYDKTLKGIKDFIKSLTA